MMIPQRWMPYIVLLSIVLLAQRTADLRHGLDPNDALESKIRLVRTALVCGVSENE